jgi:hypothetical protein
VKERIAKIIARYAKKYGAVELDQLDNFLAKFQKEIIKALGKNKFEELSYGAQNILGNSWILIDTLKFQSVPEKFIEAVCR